MSTDNKLNEIKLRLQLIMLLRKLNKIYAHDKAISSDEPKWITVHPHGKGAINKNGEDIKGTPVLIESETGVVLAGMGGKYNKRHISEACSKEKSQNFATEQKTKENAAQKHLKDLQDTAKKETKKQLKNAKAKQTQAQKKQQATKLTQPNDPSKAVDYSLLDTDVKDIASGHDLVSWKVKQRTNIVKTTEYSKDIELAYKAADGSGWKSAKGVVFDDKTLNEKFMHLEKEVYKYKALRRVNDIEKHKALDAETVEKGEKLTQQYNEVCKQWAQSQLADVSQKVEKASEVFNKEYPDYKRTPSDLPRPVREIQKDPPVGSTAYTTRQIAERFAQVCTAGKSLNDPEVKKLNCSDALKSFLISDSMYSILKQSIAYNEAAASKDEDGIDYVNRLNELELIEPAIKAAADKAKSVLLAQYGVNNVATAIRCEASRVAISSRTYIDAPAQLVGVKREKPMSFDKANNGAANPYYNSDIQAKAGEEVFKPYHINCQTCVLAHEMRLRGYDVEAQPNYQDGANMCESLAMDPIGLWRNKATGAQPDLVPLNTAVELKDTVPYGARGVLTVLWKRKGSGHIVSVGHDEKGVYVYDPQTGERHTADDYHSCYKRYYKSLCMWRIDDCDFDEKVANSVLIKAQQPPIKK